eukprot:Colp12_sorted_trinity150504_noHs@22405
MSEHTHTHGCGEHVHDHSDAHEQAIHDHARLFEHEREASDIHSNFRTCDTEPTDLEQAEREQEEHFNNVIGSFEYYLEHSLRRIAHSEASFNSLPSRHKELVPGYLKKLDVIRHAVKKNYMFIREILAPHQIFENVDSLKTGAPRTKKARPAEFEMDKVRSTIKQFVRDWSTEGAAERDACYKPILDRLKAQYPDAESRRDISVLVPGAGLGRLALEVAKEGFTCQGNEFSFYMLLASNFILNRSGGPFQYTIYPWILNFSNNYHMEDQLRAVRVPDIDPACLPPNSNFSMAAGDFLEVYLEKNKWDVVATCYFIDTAKNVVAYLEAIWDILKPGGSWINFGPLLYHFADMPKEMSIELSYEEIREVAEKIGFQFVEQEYPIKSSYIENASSMFCMQYQCVLSVAVKPNKASSK